MTEPYKPRRMINHRRSSEGWLLGEHDENDSCKYVGCVPAVEPQPIDLITLLESYYGFECAGGPLMNYVDWIAIKKVPTQAQPTPPTPLVRALMTISQLAAAMAFENFETERAHRHVDHTRIALQVEKIQAAVKEALMTLNTTDQVGDLVIAPRSTDEMKLTSHDYRFLRGMVRNNDQFPIPHAGLTPLIGRVLEDLKTLTAKLAPIEVPGACQPAAPDTAEIATLKAEVAQHERCWKALGRVMESGGQNDPVFLVGAVECDRDIISNLRRQLAEAEGRR